MFERPEPLGILVEDLFASELSWRLLKHLEKRTLQGLSSHLFVRTFSESCLESTVSSHHFHDCWGFTGPVIACSLNLAQKLACMPCPSLRVYYLWDLEWLRLSQRQHRTLAALYGDARLQLVCRTQEHARLVEDLFGRKVAGVVADACPEDIIRLGLESRAQKPPEESLGEEEGGPRTRGQRPR